MKKIAVDELRVGMFVDRVEGSWIEHGLWRTRFMVTDGTVLAATRANGVSHVWVDCDRSLVRPETSRAVKVVDPVEQIATVNAIASPRPVACPAPIAASAAGTTPFDEETARAAAILNAAREQVSALFSEARLGKSLRMDGVRSVVEEIIASVQRNSNALISLARLRSEDDHTYMHSVSVCGLMVGLAREMGCKENLCLALGVGGLMHDIGKARIPSAILQKPGNLTNEEFTIVKAHCMQGHAVLTRSLVTDDVVLDICLHHHEKFNGGGYPHRMSGEAISLAARMGAVCDVYDAVTSDRPYKAAWDPAEALNQMASWRGHFDRRVLAAFIRMVGVFPTGSLVRLASGRIARVVENRSKALRTPVVAILSESTADSTTPLELIDLAAKGVTERIVAREGRADVHPITEAHRRAS